jgi:hypothetical protein
MRIRIVKTFTPSSPDAHEDRFQPGFLYEVDGATGLLLITEGWAEPVGAEELGLVGAHLRSLQDVVAADIALDDAVASAIEQKTRRAASTNPLR